MALRDISETQTIYLGNLGFTMTHMIHIIIIISVYFCEKLYKDNIISYHLCGTRIQSIHHDLWHVMTWGTVLGSVHCTSITGPATYFREKRKRELPLWRYLSCED